MTRVLTALALTAGLLSPMAAAAQAPSLNNPASLTEKAPEAYKVRLDTSAGPVVIQVTRAWAPLGADRFYNLVKNGFYDNVRFFRVIPGFMAQGGMSGDPAIQKVWGRNNINDDPVKQSNKRGFVREDRGAELAIDAVLHQLRRQLEPRLAGICAVRPGDHRHGSRRQVRVLRPEQRSRSGHDYR